MDSNEKLKLFWDNCVPNFAHLEVFPDMDKWKDHVLPHISFDNKTCIDYGIGNGQAGYIFFTNGNLKKYIGVDISERSLQAAKHKLSAYEVEFHIIPVNFKDFNADILTSFSCIQHFPNENYLIDFLENVNNSNCKELCLQIRFAEQTKFSNVLVDKNNYNSLETIDKIAGACVTNHEYLLKHLTNYEMVKTSDVNPTTNYQYLFFKLKVNG